LTNFSCFVQTAMCDPDLLTGWARPPIVGAVKLPPVATDHPRQKTYNYDWHYCFNLESVSFHEW